VVRGAARFTLADEELEAPALSFVAILDPAVTRSAVAAENGTIVLAVGAPSGSGFATTWDAANFGQVPRAE
jgi:hypothetical protein